MGRLLAICFADPVFLGIRYWIRFLGRISLDRILKMESINRVYLRGMLIFISHLLFSINVDLICPRLVIILNAQNDVVVLVLER